MKNEAIFNGRVKIFALIAFILFFSQLGQIHSQPSLISLAPFPADLRSDLSSFAINGYGYVGVGIVESTMYSSNDFWKYDPFTNSWSQIANVPINLCMSIGFSIGGLGYLTGGISHPAPILNRITFEYNPTTNTWANKALFPLNALIAGSVSVWNGIAYVGTGDRHQVPAYSSEFYAYDPVTDTWSLKAPIPILSDYCFSFIADNKIYFGGGNDTFNVKLFEYDPVLDSWSQKNNLPFVNPNLGFNYATGFSLSNGGYIFGGRGYNLPGFSENFLHKYNHLNDTWTLLYTGGVSSPPYYGNNIYSPAIFVVNDIPYITQGVSGGNNYYNDLVAFTNLTSTTESDYSNESCKVNSISNNNCSVYLPKKYIQGKIIIYSFKGELIDTFDLHSGWNDLNINNLKSGIYLFKIFDKNSIIFSGKVAALQQN